MVDVDKRQAGAEIKVTLEMEAAGVEAYMRLLAQPEFTVDQMAREVFEATIESAEAWLLIASIQRLSRTIARA